MRILIIIALLCTGLMGTDAQGIDFFHGTWEEALAKASEENKLIFVDAYTTWCGPCKRMSKNVFPLPEVGNYYNEHFVNMKIDMEKEPGKQFGRKYPVTAYPTFYYIDPDGKTVLTTKGGRQPADFISLGELAVKKYDGSAKWKALYDEGARDHETVYNYIAALNRSGKSSVKVANEYFDAQEDLSTPENLDMLMVATTRVDSKIFGYFESEKDALIKAHGQEQVDNTIRMAAYRTGMVAIEYESQDLIDEAALALDKHLPDESEEFRLSSGMKYSLKLVEADGYYENGKAYMKKYASDDEQELAQIAKDVIQYFPEDADCVDLAYKAARQAVKVKNSESNVILLATMTYLQGDKDEALKVIDQALIDPEVIGDGSKLKEARKQFERA